MSKINAYMNIQIRVLTAQARRQLAATEAQVKSLEAQTRRAGAASSQMAYGLPQLSKWGNQVQWAGRQLQYNFTLPLLLAGGAAAKFQLDNEKAMVRVEKVYGDAAHGAEELKDEVDALGRAFEALSNKYGVQQSAVIDLAGDWAAAGASGIALAKSVDLTLQTMILGEMEAAEATEALIAVQAQYGQNTAQLAKTIDILNMVENQTGITMQGLIQGFARAAGVARSAGVDVEHLAAMLAALTPAAGSATNAGNALKTMISRLLAPTKEAAQVLGLMGIRMDDVNWKNLNAAQRLELMAEKYQELGQGVERNSRALDVNGKATGRLISSQQAIVSTVIASRWQINRWDVLMRDVARQHGYYRKSLNSTADAQANYTQRVKELNAVLESNPQRLKQMWVIIQNAMTDVIQPMIPYIVWLAQEIAQLAQSFANMNPLVQKTILIGLAFLALIGPIARYVGSVATLFGVLSAALHWFTVRLGLSTVAVMTSTGAIEMQRKGLIGLLLGWMRFAALPFTAIASGLSAVATAILFKPIPKPDPPVPDAGVARRKFDNLRGVWFMGFTNLRKIAASAYASIKGLQATFWAIMLALTLGSGGTIQAAFAAMWGRITAVSAAGQSLNLARFTAWLGSMRLAQYVWTTSMVAAFKTSMLKIGATMSLMGAFAAEAMKSLWVFLTVPGMISGNFLRIWGGMTLAASVRWTQFTLFLRMTWAKFLVAWGGMTAGAAIKIRALWAALHTAMLSISLKTYFALLAMPGRLVAATGRGLKALPALFAKLGPLLLKGFKRFGPAVLKALVRPFTLAAIAVFGVLYAFRNQIEQIWNNVVGYFRANSTEILNSFQPLVDGFWAVAGALNNAFWALPEGVRNALVAVVDVVKQAALEIYGWFSWMNPWQRHSPSLVESVQTGMQAVQRAYAKAGNVGAIFKKAASDLKAFKQIANSFPGEWADERKDVKKAFPGALPVFDALVDDLNKLNGVLAKQQRAVSAQEVVVERWSKKLEKANTRVDNQRDKLDRLRNRLQGLEDQYAAHEQALQNYASAPIKGMGKMEDAIFANEMAQKKLRLEMLKWEQANGSVDDLRDRLSKLYGDIEAMRGNLADLRASGAGSEILGPIEAQIAAMEAQARAMEGAASTAPLEKMQDELNKLQQEGEILDLEKSLKFDPMLREIDKLVNAQKELTFEEIVNGIKREQAAMERLKPKIDELTRAIEEQDEAVKRAEGARDRIQESYDREAQQLDRINEKYRETEELIRSIEDALRTMGTASSEKLQEDAEKKKKKADKYLTPGAQNFLDAAGGGYPDPGMDARIGREKIPGRALWDSQADIVDEWTKGVANDTAKMFGDLDIFGPLKKWWGRTWEWIKSNIGPVMQPIVAGVRAGASEAGKAWDQFKAGFSGGGEGMFAGLGERARTAFDDVVGWLSKAWDWGKKIAALFGPDLRRVFDALVEAGQKIWNEIGPEIAKFGGTFKLLWEAIKNVGMVVGAILIVALKLLASIISSVLGPVLDVVIDVIENIIQVIRGLLDFVLGVLAGDWSAAWNGIKDVVAGTFGAIGQIIAGAWNILVGAVKGIVLGIWELFVWLWDILVGHSVVPDMVDAIIATFKLLVAVVKWLWDNVAKPVVDVFVKLWNLVEAGLKLWWGGFTAALRILWGAAKWVWDNILKPIWNKFKEVWEDYIEPALEGWWAGLQLALQGLWAAAGWVWRNILKPIYDKFVEVWRDYIKPAVLGWYDGLVASWEGLKAIAGWVWREVVKPIKDKFVEGWEAIRDWFEKNAGIIVKPIVGVVNVVIRVINAMIDGLNKIADVLPGIDWNIQGIPELDIKKLAKGGEIPLEAKRVGNGWITSGARAIVGEGRRSYPEFVVPTDPSYRHRATELYKQLGAKLGVYDPPAFAKGGILPENAGGLGDRISKLVGGAGSLAKDGLDWVGEKVEQLASLPFAPFKAAANALINQIDWKYGQEATRSVANQVFDWVTAADEVYKNKAEKLTPPKVGTRPVIGGWTNPLAGPYSVGGSIGSYPGHTGLDLPAAVGVAIRSIASGVVSASYDIPGRNEYNDTPYDSYGRVVQIAHDNGYSSLYAHMSSRVAREGQKVFAGSLLGYVGMNGKATGPHLHLEVRGANGSLVEPLSFLRGQGVALRNGGIALARRGGVQATIAEGGQDEAVIPLPRNWRTDIVGTGKSGGSGDTIININGSLEFPNIRSGEDAEEFIKNLESLA